MTSYSSKPVTVAASAATVYERISNISAFQQKIDSLPDDVRSRIGNVSFTDDAIIINAAPVGNITLAVTERIPEKRIAFEAQSSPVPLVLAVNIEPKSDNEAEVAAAIDVEIPAMLKPMVGPKLQEAADKFGDMIRNIAQS